MVIAETVAIFSLVKGAIDVVKSAIDTSSDVKGIYTGLDDLFHHRDSISREVKKRKKDSKPKSKLHSFFSKKMGEVEEEEDDLSVGAVASMVLEKRILDREIENIGIKIDNKFGPDTWKGILETREKLLEERKENQKKEKSATHLKAIETEEFWNKIYRWIIEGVKVSGVLVIAIITIVIIWANRCTSSDC
jgi:hypothetical protein|tara:strand:- start:1057 stop:1629 length:573 start_codon:yes stop_codon:yes gene_type:complete